MALPELEVGQDRTDELIESLRDHIMTLKQENERLRAKYEPQFSKEELRTHTPARIQLPPNKIRTTSSLIEALERKTRVRVPNEEA